MKRLFYLLCISFLAILPIKVGAKEGIPNYYIFATVLSNGDVNVREIFNMSGEFNGMERIINHIGSREIFDGSIDSFKGSSIYNGDSIVINEIKGIPYSNSISLNQINKMGEVFKEVDYASKGDYGVYTKDNTLSGVDLLIYNPNSYKRAFYIDYTITNMAIVHNDISELGFNIFTELNEYVENLEMYISIPNNEKLLKVWAHGPLWGKSEIIDNQTIKVSIQKLEANTNLDVRLVFDKEVLNESHKYSFTEALGKIVTLETKQAQIANQKRQELIKKQEHKLMIDEVLNVSKVIWVLLLGLIFYKVYKYHDKEYKSEFNGKYFRDFPSDNPPATIGYLINKKIKEDELSASILMLINNKFLSFEKMNTKSKDYVLTYHKSDNIGVNDQRLLEFLFLKSFEAIEDLESVTLSELKKKANSKYGKFLGLYTAWNLLVTKEAEDKKFFETNCKHKILPIIYSVLGIIISFYSFIYVSSFKSSILSILMLVLAIISLIYFLTFTKRTKEANHEYHKWMGLKKFMEDFGTMDKKDLPDIVLWEKYLVYALVLGCAEKLSKDMKIRVKEFDDFASYEHNFDIYRFNTFISFNHSVNSTIHSSIKRANERRIASSTSSSGSGSGGGFSSGFSSGGGGGSFGGGGGGGRF